jgi:ATP-dependent protease Clp ATPase subunit
MTQPGADQSASSTIRREKGARNWQRLMESFIHDHAYKLPINIPNIQPEMGNSFLQRNATTILLCKVRLPPFA